MTTRPKGSQAPIWARGESLARRPALTREAIVAAGIGLADRDGLSAVSIRRVAAALDTRPMSLYTHVPSKGDLLDLMFDTLAEQARLGADLPDDWRKALCAIAHRVRDVGLAHAWSIELLGQRMQLGPAVIRLLDEWVAALEPLHLPAGDAWVAVTAVNDYVNGYISRQAALRNAIPRSAAEARQWQRDINAYLTTLADSGDYPHYEPLLRSDSTATGDTFDTGLTWLIDGIAATYAPSPPRRRGSKTAATTNS